jgi:predicted esterase
VVEIPVPEEASAHPRPEEGVHHGRLTARPSPGSSGPQAPGTHRLVSGQALLRVPPAPGPYRLVVVLHGAGGTAEQAIAWLLPQVGADGLLLLAPQAAASTWDLIVDGYGPDVQRLDSALAEVFRRFPVDPAGVAVAGFSDGASYALSLGVTNGDLFGAVLAFSPGFMVAMVSHGRPRIFVSHGTDDRVLPVDACSRRLVPALQQAGYPVAYGEFPGGHEVPPEVAAEALGWWTAP